MSSFKAALSSILLFLTGFVLFPGVVSLGTAHPVPAEGPVLKEGLLQLSSKDEAFLGDSSQIAQVHSSEICNGMTVDMDLTAKNQKCADVEASLTGKKSIFLVYVYAPLPGPEVSASTTHFDDYHFRTFCCTFQTSWVVPAMQVGSAALTATAAGAIFLGKMRARSKKLARSSSGLVKPPYGCLRCANLKCSDRRRSACDEAIALAMQCSTQRSGDLWPARCLFSLPSGNFFAA
ncbi:unnamed protein product [Amoebophrya sp. A120]|nr:unnamed protein product [Amoebophrya sp. A120]|eukprot:GSA120T00008743001.1